MRLLAFGGWVGFAAWHPDQPPLACLLLPVAWGCARGSGEAAALLLGYYLAGTRALPAAAAGPHGPCGPLAALLLWLALGLLCTLGWALAHPGAAASGRRAGACMALACLVTLLPPAGLPAWLHPLHLAGWLFPGSGGWGLAATGVLCALAAGAGVRCRSGRRGALAAGLAVPALVALPCLVRHPAPLPPPPGWVALSTTEAAAPRSFDQDLRLQQRLQQRARAALSAGARVVVFPELVAGRWSDLLEAMWTAALPPSRRGAATVLLGAALPTPSGLANALVRLEHAAAPPVLARRALPLALWNPLRSGDFAPRPAHAGVHAIGGQRVLVLFCYEELVPALVLPPLLGRRPATLLLVVADAAWAAGGPAAAVQALHGRSWAQLYGMPLLRATNDPGARTIMERPAHRREPP